MDCTCEPDLSEWLGGWFGISLPFHIGMALKFCFQVACGGLRPSERVDVNEIICMRAEVLVRPCEIV